MKKKIVLLFAVSIINFVQCQTNCLDKMIGEWKIEGKMFSKTGDVQSTFQGRAVWQMVYDGRYIHENFDFDFNGTKVIGEAFLGESQVLKRFEFTQIDNVNPAMFMICGNWNDSLKTLEMISSLGSIQLKWHYVFHDDGTFTKQMFLPKTDGDWFMQSAYHYIKTKD